MVFLFNKNIKKGTGKMKKRLFVINFSEKQKGEISNHRTYKDKDGNPLKMCKIYIPSKDFRDVSFGIDKNGIDRDERRAYINLPNNAVFKDKVKEGRMYTYLDEKRQYKIHFVGRPTGEAPLDGKVPFDKPEPIIVSAEELMKLYSIKKHEKVKNVKENALDKEKNIEISIQSKAER